MTHKCTILNVKVSGGLPSSVCNPGCVNNVTHRIYYCRGYNLSLQVSHLVDMMSSEKTTLTDQLTTLKVSVKLLHGISMRAVFTLLQKYVIYLCTCMCDRTREMGLSRA